MKGFISFILFISCLLSFCIVEASGSGGSWSRSLGIPFGSSAGYYDGILVLCGNSGECKIYDENQNWNEIQVLTPSTNIHNNRVSIYKNRIAIGNSVDAKVYIYEKEAGGSNNSWNLKSTLLSPVEEYTLYAFKVMLLEDIIAVSAPYAQVNGLMTAGVVYIYKKDSVSSSDGGWTLEATLTSDNPKTKEAFGTAITMNNDYIIISSEYETRITNNDPSIVYTFKRDLNTNLWNFENKFSLPAIHDHMFVPALAINNQNSLAVFGSLNDNNGRSGILYFYEKTMNSWTQKNSFYFASIESLGTESVHLGEDIAIVSVFGKILTYVRNPSSSNSWELENTLISGTDVYSGVFLHGRTLMVTRESYSGGDHYVIYKRECPSEYNGNVACTLPSTVVPTCQTGWKSNTFGAPKPIITTSYNNDLKKFILNVEMYKNDLPDQNTFNSLTLSKLNNLDSNSNCKASEVDNSPFTIINDGECSKKYEYQFGTAELGSSNNFDVKVSNDGNSLIYSSFITSSYSSNDINIGVCSLYQFTTKVQYQLSLVASQTEFTSVDNIGKFIVKRLYINNEKKFVIEGKLSTLFDKVSSFQDITLTKQNAPSLTLSQSSATSCGNACYNLIFTSNQIASESLDDTYKLQFKMSELPSDSNAPVENTRSLSINILIQYTVPVDPSIISGNDITSSIKLYNSNDATSRPSISYSTNDKVFLGNAMDDANIILPTNTKFSPLNAKVCCVPSATAFPSTGCSGSGHSAYSDLIINKVAQQNVDIATEGQTLNSKTAISKEYLLQFLIKDKLSNLPTTPQTCRIYIESTFQTTLNARNLEGNQLLTTIVKSQSSFSIVAESNESEEMIHSNFNNNADIANGNYNSIIISSVIVGGGLVLSSVIAILAVAYIYYQKKNNSHSENV